MSETPVAPVPIRDVLLRLGEALGGRGKRGFFAASAVMLGGIAVIVYFTVFPVPRLGPRPQPDRAGPRLGRGAVAVTNAFTQLGWNEHDCVAADRYAIGRHACPSRVLPHGSFTFVLNTWQIEPRCAGRAPVRTVSALRGRPISPGCIEYTAANGETISYTMAKLPQGWRVVAAAGHRGPPVPDG